MVDLDVTVTVHVDDDCAAIITSLGLQKCRLLWHVSALQVVELYGHRWRHPHEGNNREVLEHLE